MTKTDTSREAVGRLCVRLCHPTAGFRPTVSDAREAAETMRALLTERDALQARAERAEAGLTRIAEMEPHHAGQTPNEYHMQEIARATLAQLDAEPEGVSEPAVVKVKPLQERVGDWMQECFGPEISADKLERGDRLLEEVFELLQSGDYPVDRVAALRDYVWGREKGEPFQEVGGVMITLAAYCLAHGLDMAKACETEADRITQPEMVRKIRAKQAAKPTGSALPVALEPGQTHREGWEQAKEAVISMLSKRLPLCERYGIPVQTQTYEEAIEDIRAMDYPGDSQ